MGRYTKAHEEEALQVLTELLHPGQTVYVIQRHRTPSGHSRIMSLVISKAGRCIDITLRTAILLNKRTIEKHGKEGIRVEGLAPIPDDKAKNKPMGAVRLSGTPAQALVSALSEALFSEQAPKGKNADPDSALVAHRPADQWLQAEWL